MGKCLYSLIVNKILGKRRKIESDPSFAFMRGSCEGKANGNGRTREETVARKRSHARGMHVLLRYRISHEETVPNKGKSLARPHWHHWTRLSKEKNSDSRSHDWRAVFLFGVWYVPEENGGRHLIIVFILNPWPLLRTGKSSHTCMHTNRFRGRARIFLPRGKSMNMKTGKQNNLE